MHFSRLNLFITGWLLSFIAFFWNCSDLGTNPDSKDNNGPSDTISYAGDIQPIFNSNCTGCHGNLGGLNLSSYNGLMAGGNNGAVVTPGIGESSTIVLKLSSDPPFGVQMPKDSSPLSADKIELITTWIDEGAENN